MHRGGTSAVAGTAVRLGLAPPLTPLPAADDNPTGFHESLAVVHINDLLLKAAGCGWNACLSFDPDRLAAAVQIADWPIIAEILQLEFRGAAGFVLKDPRLCLTLPAWLPALRAAGTDISVLLAVRHPEEVIRSLSRRDRLPEAETAPLWLHHMLEAERLSRTLPRAVVFYDDLLGDWRRCMAEAGRVADIAWPAPIDRTGPEIDDYLLVGLRHHSAGPHLAIVGPPPVRDMIHDAWVALRRLRDDPGASVALARLDQVRVRFAAWRREFHPPRQMAAPQEA